MKDNKDKMYHLCKDHLHSYVMAETNDGYSFDGIITGLDDEYVYFAVPIEQDNTPERTPASVNELRQYGYGYGGYPGYGSPFYGYGHPPRRFRRFILPLAALTAISLLPWY